MGRRAMRCDVFRVRCHLQVPAHLGPYGFRPSPNPPPPRAWTPAPSLVTRNCNHPRITLITKISNLPPITRRFSLRVYSSTMACKAFVQKVRYIHPMHLLMGSAGRAPSVRRVGGLQRFELCLDSPHDSPRTRQTSPTLNYPSAMLILLRTRWDCASTC